MAADDSAPETPAVQHGPGDDSIVELARQPIVVAWVKYVTALFAFAAVGVGVFTILLDVVDLQTLGLEFGVVPTGSDSLADGFLLFGGLTSVAVVGIVAATFVGAFLGWHLPLDDRTTSLAAALSALAGVLVLWTLAGVLGGVGGEFDLRLGDLLLNGILAGIGGAIGAAGGVWTSRTVAPASVDGESDADAAVPVDR